MKLDEYRLPSGRTFTVPFGLSAEEVDSFARRQFPDEIESDYFQAFIDTYFSEPDLPVEPLRHRPPEEPNILQEFEGALKSAFFGTTGSIIPGIRAGIAHYRGDEEAFDQQIQLIQQVLEESGKFNRDPSSIKKVKEEWTRGGLFPAAGEIIDLAVQGVGGSIGWMVPSLTLLTVGSAAKVFGLPWIAAAGLGGYGAVQFAQFFGDQLETSYSEAAEEGKEVDIEDINLGNQVLSALGQTVAQSIPVAGAGLMRAYRASPAVRNAANTAIARTGLKALEKADIATKAGQSRFGAFAKVVGEELGTEQLQNLMQRAAAGQEIALEDQEAFDSYIETFFSTLLTSGVFGGLAAINVRPEVETEGKITARDIAPSTVPTALAPAMYGPGIPVPTPTAEASAKSLEEAQELAAQRVEEIAGAERSVEDIMRVIEDRNLEVESSREAEAALDKLVYETIGDTNLTKATPQQRELVYETVAALPRLERRSRLPLTTEEEALGIAKRIIPKTKVKGKQRPKRKLRTEEQIKERITAQLKKEPSIFATEGYADIRTQAIFDQIRNMGLLVEQDGKFLIEEEVVDLATRQDIQEVTEAIEEIVREQPVGTQREGKFPSFRELQKETGLKSEEAYRQIRDFYIRRRLIQKLPKDPETGRRPSGYYFRDYVDRRAQVKRPRQEPIVPSRTTVERSGTPVTRWLVEDSQGRTVPGGIFKSQEAAKRFIENQNLNRAARSRRAGGVPGYLPGTSLADLRPPRRVRGYAINEQQYETRGDRERLVKSTPRDFVPEVGRKGIGRAEDLVREYQERQALREREARPEFLAGEEITDPTQKQIARAARAQEARDHHRAVQMMMKTPASFSSVLNSYQLGIEHDTAANNTVQLDEEGTTNLGNLPFDQLGIYNGKPVPVVVKQGYFNPESGAGFGQARLDTQNAQIQELTAYDRWQDMLQEMFTRFEDIENATGRGEITVFSEGAGRNVVIWKDPTQTEPMVAVLDYFEDANGPQYHVYNAFAGQNYASNVETRDLHRGIPERRGPGVTTEAVFAIHNPAHALELSPGDAASLDMGPRETQEQRIKKRSPNRDERMLAQQEIVSSAERLSKVKDPNAVRHRPGHFVHYLQKGLSWIMNKAGVKNARERHKARKYLFDSLDPAVRAGLSLKDKQTQDFVDAMIDASSEVSLRMVDRIIPMFVGVAQSGTVQYMHTGNTMERGVWRPVELPMANSTRQQLQLNPETNQYALVDVDARMPVMDQDGQLKWIHAESNLYNEERQSTIGGIQTILSGARKGDQSLVPELMRYAQGVRALHLSDPQLAGGSENVRSTGFSQQELNEALALGSQHPEILVAYRNLQNWNDTLLDYAKSTGLITQAEYDFMKDSWYTPFYLNLDAEANAHLKAKWEQQQKLNKNLGKVTTLRDYDVFRKFIGIEAMEESEINRMENRLVEPLEALMRNSMGLVLSGTRNVALYRSIRDAMAAGWAKPWNEVDDRTQMTSQAVEVKVNGVNQKFYVEDPLMLEMMTGVDRSPWMTAIMKSPTFDLAGRRMSNFLRESVVRNPGFIFPNILRDSLTVYLMNGGDPRMLYRVWKRIGRNIRPRNVREGIKTPESEFLRRYGVTTGYEHTDLAINPKGAGKDLLRKVDPKSDTEFFAPIRKLWDDMGRVSSYSESATREEVFQHVYKQSLEKFKNQHSDTTATILAEAEAAHQATEILNFSRRGDSQGIRVLSAMAPFINARMQGIDVLGRGLFGYRPVGINREDMNVVRQNLIRRGLWLAAGSSALALINFGDDDYENEAGYRRDDHWHLPIGGTGRYLTLPIPFELGFFFKVLPEQITRSVLFAASDEGGRGMRDFLRSFGHVLKSNFGAGSFVPVAARPLLHWVGNQDSHTGIEIDPYWEKKTKHAADRYGPRTTAQARILGQLTGQIGISPRMLDNWINTVGGGLIAAASGILDHALRSPAYAFEGYPLPVKPLPTSRDIVAVRRFISNPNVSNALASEIYEWSADLDKTYALVRDAAPERQPALYKKHEAELLAREQLKPVLRHLKKTREQRNIAYEQAEGSLKGQIDLKETLNKLRELDKDPIQYYLKVRKQFDRS